LRVKRRSEFVVPLESFRLQVIQSEKSLKLCEVLLPDIQALAGYWSRLGLYQVRKTLDIGREGPHPFVVDYASDKQPNTNRTHGDRHPDTDEKQEMELLSAVPHFL
jgi:hypothetical protein